MITGLDFNFTGVVVNNAILIVERALQLQEREYNDSPTPHAIAYDQFMSAGTSVLGILPLAAFQGKVLSYIRFVLPTGGLAFSRSYTNCGL